MNEAAQLAEEHGVAFIDYLVGPHTGPRDGAAGDYRSGRMGRSQGNRRQYPRQYRGRGPSSFRLPPLWKTGIKRGNLGDKTPERGGFYRRDGKAVEVLEPRTGPYEPLKSPGPIDFVEQMKSLNRVGRYATP